MNSEHANLLGLKDNQKVKVRVHADRPMLLEQVQLRVSEKFVTEMHLDTDDANASGLTQGELVQVVQE
jgi:putative phosphotransacetylase